MKTSIVLFALMALLCCAPTVNAQLHVTTSGDIGIGTTAPIAKLDVRSVSNYRSMYLNNTYSGATSKYGVYNYLSTAGTGNRYGLYNRIMSNTSSSYHYGFYNYSYINSTNLGYGQYNYTYCAAGDGDRYGIYNYLNCGTSCGKGTKYALYSSLDNNCGGGYAGYFNGDVYIAGSLTSTSDAAKKTNINELTGALSLIGQLKPKTYNFIPDPDLSLPTEKQYGFLAQELETVLPDLVKTVETIGNKEVEIDGEKLNEPVTTGEIKTVNYMAMIPVLVQGMQEQQVLIEAQAKRIEELEAKINK